VLRFYRRHQHYSLVHELRKRVRIRMCLTVVTEPHDQAVRLEIDHRPVPL
jgi:hypothetical protein